MRNSPIDFYKKLLGRRGEKRALKYLKKLRYKILEKNYKTFFGEADIIAFKNDTLIFVEVKTRTNCKYGTPLESITIAKQKRYIKIAKFYLHTNNMQDIDVRFDCIVIYKDKLKHIENAFSN